MSRQIIRDYFHGFRLENVKKIYANGAWWIYAYFISLWPLIMHIFDSMDAILYYYMGILPMLFCLFSATTHPMRMPKIMYLCPMDEEDRKKYVKGAYWFKLFFPLLTAIPCLIILFVTVETDWFYGATVLVGLFALGVIFGIDPGAALSNTGGQQGYRKPFLKELRIWQPLAGVVGVISEFFVVILMPKAETWWEVQIFLWIVVLVQLPFVTKLLSCQPLAVKYAMNYENVFEKQKK